MFVRIRTYDRPGWRGVRLATSASGHKFLTAGRNRHHARPPATHYTVLESVRTEKGPRQRVVASWTDAPGIVAAIEQAQVAIAKMERQADEEREFWEEEGKWQNFTLCVTWEYRRWLKIKFKVGDLHRQIERLEAARATLGDWKPPAG
jgi:hypothetical protein